MATDADEASSALIAKLLAQDYQQQSAYAGGSYYDDDVDFDYEEPKKKKRKKKASAAQRKVNAEKDAEKQRKKEEKEAERQRKKDERAALQQKKSAEKEAAREAKRVESDNPNRKMGKWDEEEERLFLEALELYGRDWHKCVAHMNYSRDRGGFTSHAQKYFIKLYKENRPLPAKVAESGEGYTLSGNPLDPESAAARAYGLQGDEGMKAYRQQIAQAKSGDSPSNSVQAANGDTANKRACPEIDLASQPRALKSLLDIGGLKPGPKCLVMKYKDATYEGSLAPDGTIYFDKKPFVSPSAWALYVIHVHANNPTRKAVNGWSCVKYNDEFLHNIQRRFIERIHGSPGKSMSAREKNDLLLNIMKADGATLGQKIANGPQPYVRPGKSPEEIEAYKAAQAAAKAARDAAIKARQDKIEEQDRLKAEKRTAKESARLAKLMEKEAEERRKRAALYGDDGRTAYSRMRSRRAVSSRFTNTDSQTLQFVECFHYGSRECCRVQPFTVEVAVGATLLVDLHAHLTKREVIGYLVGTWDPVRSKIVVKDAYPGKSIAEDGGAFTEAEMDPVVEVELRSRIAEAGLSVVGWYHSHPTFQPTPSMVDIANQCNYQHLFHDGSNNVDPFIGMIVGPYDINMPSPVSRVEWYYAESPGTQRIPMTLKVSPVYDPIDGVLEKMENLIESYTMFPALIDFNEQWKNTPGGTALTYMQALMKSLEDRVVRLQKEKMFGEDFSSGFLTKVDTLMKEYFTID